MVFLHRINGENITTTSIGSIVFSALVTVEVVIGIIDLAFALMCIPNMIAMIYLAKRVKNEMRERNWLN